MQELSSAMQFMHTSLHIMHCDIKPANVFMDQIGCLKVGDFGLSKGLATAHDMCVTFVGTPLYMSPEQCRGDEYSFPADMWSLGCILYELMALRSPWLFGGSKDCPTIPALMTRIQTKRPRFDSLDACYSKDLVHLCKWMLDTDHQRRMTSQQLFHVLQPKGVERRIDVSLPREDLFAKATGTSAAPARIPFPSMCVEADIRVLDDQGPTRRRKFVGDARDLAARCIQGAFRKARGARVVATDHCVCDDSSTLPGAEMLPRPEERSVRLIQKVARKSMTRRRLRRQDVAHDITRDGNGASPKSPPVKSHAQPAWNRCSERVRELATPLPRLLRLHKTDRYVGAEPLKFCALPPVRNRPLAPPVATPRPAWI